MFWTLLPIFLINYLSLWPRVTSKESPPSLCHDYAGRAGTCGRIQDCPALLRLVSGRNPTADEVSHLRRSQCGKGQGQLLLCCAYGRSNPFGGPPEEHPNREILENGSICGTIVGNRITGGHAVASERNPWLALIGYRHPDSGNLTYQCGGALIGGRHVLTAAHCVTGLPDGLRLHSVRLGENDLGSEPQCGPAPQQCAQPPQELQILSVDIHEDYNKPFRMMNDLALLTLDGEAQEGSTVGKICLPYGDDGDYSSDELTVAGFGRVGSADGPASAVPLQVTLPAVDQQQCAEAIALLGGRLGPRQLCAGGERGRDVCFGDSGSPLTAPSRHGDSVSVVGVVAFGDKTCQGNIPGVFTKVSAYLNWILDRVA